MELVAPLRTVSGLGRGREREETQHHNMFATAET